jgi:predicted ATPase
MLIVGPGGKPLPTSRELRIVERLRRTAADAIDYEIAVEDPVVLTQPWKAAFPLNRDDAYRMFEYACHEDNTAIRNFIETSRFERRAQQ